LVLGKMEECLSLEVFSEFDFYAEVRSCFKLC
jgi:hypothetical protein